MHGIGSAYARAQTGAMQRAGTKVVAGVSVGFAGQDVLGVPVFDCVAEAVQATGANTSAIYIPAAGARDALIENADAGVQSAFLTAEFVPVHDVLFALNYARSKGMWVIGPNSLGVCAPGIGMLGSIAPDFCSPGSVGLMSRSGTLTLATSRILSAAGIGQSVCVHIGGDVLAGRNPSEYLDAFANDAATRAIAYCGEVGGSKEYAMVEQLPRIKKPLVALIVGRSAPPGKRMGHAGALAGAARETAMAKRDALRQAGAHIADSPMHMAQIIKKLLS